MLFRILFVAQLLGWASLTAQPLAAQPPAAQPREYRAALEDMLERGWVTNGGALAEARRRYAEARGFEAADARAELAMALVELRHRNFREAEELLRAGIARDPHELDVQQAYVWLLTYTRKHAAALTAMRDLAARFPPEAEDDPEREAAWQAAAELCGRILAYLRGPGASQVGGLAEVEREVRDKLGSARLDSFEAAYAGLQEEHAAMQREFERISAQDVEDEAKRVELERAFIARERERIAGELGTLQDSAAAVQSEGEQRLSSIDGQLQPLQRRYNELAAQAAPYNRRILDLEQRVASLQAAAAGTRDAGERDRLLREAERWRSDLRREELAVRPLLVELQRVQSEGQQLSVQRNQVVGAVQTRLAALERQRKSLVRTSGLLDKSESALGSGGGTSGRARSLTLQMEAFTTYQKYPLEEVRARLLRALAEAGN